MNQTNSSYTKSFFSNKILFLLVTGIFISTLSLRLYIYDPNVPVFLDSLQFFSYAVDINVLESLPSNYTVTKPAWPIFLSILFTLFDYSDTMSYMQIQKISGIVLSSITIFPLYFLCNRFVEKKYSIIAVSLFAFAPRLIENSLYGTTYPLFLLFFVLSLLFFLSTSKRLFYLSFLVSGITTIIRPEGIFLFFSLAIMLIIKIRNQNYRIPKYLLALSLFFIILIPMVIHTEEITPGKSIFGRIINTTDLYLETQNDTSSGDSLGTSSEVSVLTGLYNFPIYLGWVLIPMFIITVPIGFILFFKKPNFKKTTIILISIICSLPAFYAYSYPLQETKYLYLLIPMFSIFSTLSIKFFLEKFNFKNYIFPLMIGIILISSFLFINYKIDVNYDREYALVAKKIVDNNLTLNDYYPESYYIHGLDVEQNWAKFKSFHKNIDRSNPDGYPYSTKYYLPHKINTISLLNESGIDDSEKFNSLTSFIFEHNETITHIITDPIEHRPSFIKDVFYNEKNYPYLIKIWDSKDDGFTNHIKIFEINFKMLESKIIDQQLP